MDLKMFFIKFYYYEINQNDFIIQIKVPKPVKRRLNKLNEL